MRIRWPHCRPLSWNRSPAMRAINSLTQLGTLTPEAIAASPYVAKVQADFAAEAGIGDPGIWRDLNLPSSVRSACRQDSLSHFSTRFTAPEHPIQAFRGCRQQPQRSCLPAVEQSGVVPNAGRPLSNWPMEAAARQVKDPVSSSVPTLILQGAYDTRTPVWMGKRAARELENSTLRPCAAGKGMRFGR